MIGLLGFILASHALFEIISSSSLPGWHRLRSYLMGRSETFATLILCPYCLGFWIGCALSCVFDLNLSVSLGYTAICGLIGAASCGMIGTVANA